MTASALLLSLISLCPLRAADELAPPRQGLTWAPIVDAQVLLGQVLQNTKATSWQGNASLQVTPAVRLSDSVSVLPTYAGSYQGTKSVTELAGGGQLFQDSQSHLLNLKGVFQRGRWRFKPDVSYRWELLRETSQEAWGRGLFDYRKRAAGVEAEYALRVGGKLTAGFDYYAIDFPNYASLESQVAAGLGREQLQTRTLNTRNLSGSLGGIFPLPFHGGSARLAGSITQRDYPDQYLVAPSGALTPERRGDRMDSIDGSAQYGLAISPRVAGLLSAAVSYSRYFSNQNHYDAELNIFNPDFYSYGEVSVEPKATAILGARKVEVAFSYLRIERDYKERMAQDAAGSYLGETTRLSQDSFQFDLSIPLARGFKFVAHSALTNSASNMRYEKFFRYNYTLSSHLLGFSYSL